MLDKILHSLYSAAGGSSDWSCFLDDWSEVIGGEKAVFFTQSFESDEVGTSVLSRWDPDSWVDYGNYYAGINSWMEVEDRLRPGTAVVGQQLCPDHQLFRSEFYNDWLKREGVFHAIGGVIIRDGAWCSKVSVLRSKERGCYSSKDYEMACTLMPHMQTAVELHNRIARLESVLDNALDALDRLPLGAVLLSAEGKVIFQNRSASLLLARGDGLSVAQEGRFIASNKEDAVRLKSVITSALSLNVFASIHKNGFMLIRRKSGADPYQLLVSPFRNSEFSESEQKPAAVIFITDPDTGFRPRAEAISALFNLTPQEGRVAELITDGHSVATSSELLEVTIGTLRQHLKSIYRKTDTDGQSGLARKILRSPLATLDRDKDGM